MNGQKLKISSAKIAQNSTLNMNHMKSVKYGLSPEEIEKRSLAGERFKTVFNMYRIEKSQRLHRRRDRYDVMKYSTKRKKLREKLFVGEKVLVIAERIKKKAAPSKFYKQFVQNISLVIWQKEESQNRGNKNTKHAKFPEKRTFFTS